MLAALVLTTGWAQARTLPIGPPEKWKYLTFDASSDRLYIAHGTEVTIVDTASWRVLGRIAGFDSAHEVAIGRNHHGYATSNKAAAVVVFDTGTLRVLKTIRTGADCNTISFDPVTGRVFAMNDDAGTVTVIDTATDQAVATLTLPGGEGLEQSAADGAGHVYVDHAAGSDLVRIDAKRAVVDRTYALGGCVKPRGLALSTRNHTAYVTCENKMLVAIDTAGGGVIGSVAIGGGSESVVYDAARRRVIVPTADGMLDLVGTAADGGLGAVTYRKTGPAARTAAEDARSGDVYVVTSPSDLLELRP